jgi:hypothetical protein
VQVAWTPSLLLPSGLAGEGPIVAAVTLNGSRERQEAVVLVIKTVSGTEIRIPLHDIESMSEVEPSTGETRHAPPHPYIHREGVNRCMACWRARTDPSHTDQAVHE